MAEKGISGINLGREGPTFKQIHEAVITAAHS